MKNRKNITVIEGHAVQLHLNAYLMPKNPNKLSKQLKKLLNKHGLVSQKGYMAPVNQEIVAEKRRAVAIEEGRRLNMVKRYISEAVDNIEGRYKLKLDEKLKELNTVVDTGDHGQATDKD